PKRVRAATSAQKLDAIPWPASPRAIRTSATSVTRRTPNRSPIMPAGIETIRIATLALASRNPDSSGVSAKRCAYSGTSGMIALHIASPTNTAANSRRTTGRRTRAECQTACPGRGACRAHTPSRRRPGDPREWLAVHQGIEVDVVDAPVAAGGERREPELHRLGQEREHPAKHEVLAARLPGLRARERRLVGDPQRAAEAAEQ